MADQTILITGGTGFAGSHLIELLLESHPAENIHTTAFSDSQSRAHELLPAANIHRADLTKLHDAATVVQTVQPTQVYHLASFAAPDKSFDSAQKVLTDNTDLQLSVLNAVKEHAPEARILAISSAAVYSPAGETKLTEDTAWEPLNPYAISKATQEMLAHYYAKAFQLNVVIARSFNHIGARQTPHFAVPAFAQQIAKIEAGQQDSLKVGNLEAIRDFSDVRDVVRAYQTLMESGATNGVYNVGSGAGHSMQEVVDSLVEMAKTPIKVEQDPSRMRPVDVPYMVADVSKLEQLGWKPRYSLVDSLQAVLTYWRETV